MSNETKVVTGKARFCYLNAWTPKKNDSGKEVYSVTLVIPKSDKATIDKIEAAIVAAYDEGIETLQGNAKKAPSIGEIKTPLRDGDEEREGDEIFAGSYFINATSIYAPGIFDANRQVISEQDQFYSGCYGRASISFYAYNKKGGKGIACGLRGLQKLEDGERLGGFASVAEDFAD